MVRRCGLRDEQWEKIEALLPGRAGTVGVTAQDHRLFVEAVLYRYRAGIPWRDLPARFGDWPAAIGAGLSAVSSAGFLPLWRKRPTTNTRCSIPRSSAPTSMPPGQKGDRQIECIGRSTGGLTTKIHATCDARGYPTGFHLTPE